jgi:hypothetical protein
VVCEPPSKPRCSTCASLLSRNDKIFQGLPARNVLCCSFIFSYFSKRHNVIKTWATTVDDLLSLGLKIYLPDIQTHGLLHLGTRDIQLTLLKSGLLLGIEFRYDSTVKGIVERDDQCSAYRAWFSSNSVAASRSSTASSNSDDEPTTTTGDEAATASVESPAVGAGGPEIASVLSFSPCEQRPEELWHTSVVDMIEPAASECGAVVARSAVDGDAAELVEFDGIIVAEGEVRVSFFDKALHE